MKLRQDPVVAQQPPTTSDDSAREAERLRELEAAKRDAEEAERQRQAAEQQRQAAERQRQADVAAAQAETEKAEQLLASERQWETEIGSIVLGLVLLLILVGIFAFARIKRRTSLMTTSSKDASIAANVTKQTDLGAKAEGY
jgi:uncharacterized membrane protein YdbT with pleckstrin-like domain